MPSKPPRILCVDDQEDFLILLDHFLTANDFSVVATPKGQEALRFAEHERFSAAVVDYAMPEMNGEELAVKLRKIRPEMPIVLFSASSHDLPESVFAAVDLTVSKSFPISNLVTVLKRLTRPVGEERRNAPRSLVELEVRVAGLNGGAAVVRTADLSRGGIGLSTKLPAAIGRQLEIEIANKSGQLLLATRAEVRYVAAGRTGLAFRSITEQQRAVIAAMCARS